MARPLRIQFAGAIYHAIARGNARQPVFREDRDYQRFLEGMEATVDKFGFEVFGFVCMPNHVHLFFRTPRPNLSQGMQFLLAGYANWFNTRHRRSGHLFQGRFKGELIEDERYFWSVSRYLHLNPLRTKKPLVRRLDQWRWSSYPGYRHQRHQVDWVAYASVYRAWQGWRGAADVKKAAEAYRRFVVAGIDQPPVSPFSDAIDGWLLGSQVFVDRIKKLLQEPLHADQVPQARKLRSLPLATVLEAAAQHFQVAPAVFAEKRSTILARDIGAWLARRLTTLTLRELAETFGLTHPDSLSNLTRRAERALAKSPKLRREVEALRNNLLR